MDESRGVPAPPASALSSITSVKRVDAHARDYQKSRTPFSSVVPSYCCLRLAMQTGSIRTVARCVAHRASGRMVEPDA
jgi:hypothetical protein